MPEPHVALLRGINVGGRNKLRMKDLVAIFEDTGCRDVRTYIQSGNVVFQATSALAERVGTEVPRRIAEGFGLRAPVIIRTTKEFRDTVKRHPFVAEARDPTHLHIGFLADVPHPESVASLDPARSDVDSFAVLGKAVFLYVPGGMARTKLTTDYFDRRLGTVMTVRNWRTVNTLVEMIGTGG